MLTTNPILNKKTHTQTRFSIKFLKVGIFVSQIINELKIPIKRTQKQNP